MESFFVYSDWDDEGAGKVQKAVGWLGIQKMVRRFLYVVYVDMTYLMIMPST
jgi:hypothetical protein